MRSFCGRIRLVGRHAINSSKIVDFNSTKGRPITGGSVLIKPNSSHRNEAGGVNVEGCSIYCSNGLFYPSLRKFISLSPSALTKRSIKTHLLVLSNYGGKHSVSLSYRGPEPGHFHQSTALQTLSSRCITTMNNSDASIAPDACASVSGVASRIKFKRLDKTAKHIMQILDKEAVEEVRKQR